MQNLDKLYEMRGTYLALYRTSKSFQELAHLQCILMLTDLLIETTKELKALKERHGTL